MHYVVWFIEVFGVTLLLLALPFTMWYIRHRREDIAWGRVVLTLALCGDVLMTLILTLLRLHHDSWLQPYPFATWRDAWNTRAEFDQLFLNIGVFVPFGALLALRFARLRNLVAPTLISLGFSLFIEVTQLITARGVGDVDDLFCNALGGLLGGAAVCLVDRLRQKRRRRALIATLPFLAAGIACAVYFASYAALPYGTLILAPNHTHPMRNVAVTVACPIADTPTDAPVYRGDAVVATEPILSPREAVDALRAGRFRYDHDRPGFTSLALTDLALIHVDDTKGYTLPVWRCTVVLDGAKALLYIPALRQS